MGAWLERAWLASQGRDDRESRALASRRRRSVPAARRLAMGARPRRASAERVRQLLGNARRSRADEFRSPGRVRVRALAGGGACQGPDVGGARSFPAAAPVSAGPRLASRDERLTHVVIRGNVSESRYEAPYRGSAAWYGRRLLAGIWRRQTGQGQRRGPSAERIRRQKNPSSGRVAS